MPKKLPRPIVAISRCLEIAPCRYDGGVIPFGFINQLEPFVKFIPVCPEVEIGLGTPRDPVRLVMDGGRNRLVQPATGKRLTLKMRRFSKNFLGGLGAVDGFILKSRSPSCGLKDAKLYAGALDKAPVGKGPGLFAGAVLAKFAGIAIEDEARLTRPAARAHFLTKLFTLAAFRKVKKSPSARGLAWFHGEYSPLLRALGPRAERALGALADIAGGPAPLDDRLARYEKFSASPSPGPYPKSAWTASRLLFPRN